MPTIAVSIVEDNEKLKDALVALLEGAPGFSCSGAHATAEAAVVKVPHEKPDVVLMDIRLPGRSGIDCVRELKAKCPSPISFKT